MKNRLFLWVSLLLCILLLISCGKTNSPIISDDTGEENIEEPTISIFEFEEHSDYYVIKGVSSKGERNIVVPDTYLYKPIKDYLPTAFQDLYLGNNYF